MLSVRYLEQQRDGLDAQFEKQGEKLRRLRVQFAIETEVDRKFKLEEQIKEAEEKLSEIARQITEIERQLRQQTEEPGPTPFMPFANRKAEWERVVLYPEGQYYLFEGPAGYGKTALLQKLNDEFTTRHWLSAYVSLQENSTVTQIADLIARKLRVQADVLVEEHRAIGEELGKAVAQQREVEEDAGLALLIDVDHEPWESVVKTLESMVESLIPGIHQGLKGNSDHYKNTPLSFRVAIVGRYIISHIKRFQHTYQFNAVQLKPFDYSVVRDICEEHVRDAQDRDDFAANLLFYSGGHPRCMVRVLQKFADRNKPPGFFHSHHTDVERIALLEADFVYTSITRDWRRVFDTLCVYRRLDHFLLRRLLDEGRVWHGNVKDEYDLADRLKLSYLMDWADELHTHLCDDITRRLLHIRLRYDIADTQFQRKCKDAEDHCSRCLDQTVEYSPYWAIETLFEYLQGNVSRITDIEARQKIRQEFFETRLPEVLRKLKLRREPRLQIESLRGVLDKDWEFQFTLNYYLRSDHYDETPYQELLRYLDQSCQNFVGDQPA